MKNLYYLFSFLSLVVSARAKEVVYNSTESSSLCYDWKVANNEDSQLYWLCGTPAADRKWINSCSGDRSLDRPCWVTFPQYPDNLTISVFSPLFDLTMWTNLTVQFNVVWDVETFFDGVNFAWNTNSTNTAQIRSLDGFDMLGSPTITLPRWYNQWFIDRPNDLIAALNNYSGGGYGWSGIDDSEVNHGNWSSHGWIPVSLNLPIEPMSSKVQFRFSFASDGSVSGFDGFGFDKFVLFGDRLSSPLSTFNLNPSTFNLNSSTSSQTGNIWSKEATSPSSASTSTSQVENQVENQVESSTSDNIAMIGGIIGGVIGGIILTTFLGIFFKFLYPKLRSKRNPPTDLRESGNGIRMTEEQRKKFSDLASELKLQEIVMGTLLGSGNFGNVYRGLWQETTPVVS
eukprot:TRINITY_DN534_c0_g2_i2.p1 TRINITY_DN534_c0_g2~~TRINITY_DN534_c0_g2_i2.p1  ORF type:complete len:400 (-),score=136.67 TRINITY_DN534_c0_g2_i2:791-1990(-)